MHGITDAVEDFADPGVTINNYSWYGITDAFDGDLSIVEHPPLAGYGIQCGSSIPDGSISANLGFGDDDDSKNIRN